MARKSRDSIRMPYLSLRGGLDADYLDAILSRLYGPLMKKELGGVEAVLDFMSDYSLLRDDMNSITELATWSFKPEPKVDAKTKAALTRAYKKRSFVLPYFNEEKVPTKRTNGDFDDDEEEGDDDMYFTTKRQKSS